MNRHIARVALSVSAVTAVTVPFFFVPGCLSSPSTATDSGTPGTTGSSSSGSGSGSNGGGDDGGGSTGPTVCLGPDAGPVDPSCVVDDMTTPAIVSGGYWYTYSDRTFPNTTDVVDGSAAVAGTIIATADGFVSPAEGEQFFSNMGAGGPTVPGFPGTAPFREFSGGGLTLWGAGMGFNWTNVIPPGTDMSDAADAAPALGVPGPYDASAHKGITFYGKSNGAASLAVGLHFSDAREAAAAGECDATVYLNGPLECGDDYFKNYTFTTSWQNFTVKFADPLLKTQNYTTMDLAPGKLDTTHLYQVHFQVNNAAYAGKGATDAGPAFDISVAYITWYDGT